MMQILQAIHCHQTAKRLSKYLDMDPSAPLSQLELSRVREHLAECQKCTELANDLKNVKSRLRWLGASRLADQSSLAKLTVTLDGLSHREE